MYKKEFTYRNNKAITLWYLLLAAPVILLKELVLDQVLSPLLHLNEYISDARDILYLLFGAALTIGIILYLWKNVLNRMPGVQKKGYYWIENGVVCMQLDERSYRWDHVDELFIKDRDVFSGGIRLLIKKGDKESIWILSEYMAPDTDISETVFATIFKLVLAGNPSLMQEEDAFHEPMEYFYKKARGDQ